MQGIMQFILGNLWILVPILIGLFNVGVRMQQKAKEQRAKRAALAEIQRRKTDSMRTGKPVNEPVIVYDEPQKTQKQQAKEERQARIEALRKQRMEQLRAMREKRAAASTATPTRPTPTRTPARTGRQPSPARPALRTPQTRTPPSRPRVIPPTTQMNRGAPPRPRVIEPTSRPTPIPDASPGLDTPAPMPKKIKPGANPIASPRKQSDTDSLLGSSEITARSMLRNRRLTRQAIIAREILDSPIALRDAQDAPGSYGA